MAEEILTGVETNELQGAAAPEEEEDLFTVDESGEKEEVAAEPVKEEKGDEERVEKAFAKRLEQEREKIRREIEEQYRPKPESSPQTLPTLPRQEAERLADELNTSVEMVYALYSQQVTLNQYNETIKKQNEQFSKLSENLTKAESFRNIEKMRKQNPGLPEVKEEKLAEIRSEYKSKYGQELPWEEAYEKQIAKEALSGNLNRQIEQETIAKITKRDKATIQAGKGGQAKKPDIWEMPSDQFDKLVEEAKMGKFKKS